MLGHSDAEAGVLCQSAPQKAQRLPDTVGWSQRQLLPRQQPLSGFFQKRQTSMAFTSNDDSRDLLPFRVLSFPRPFALTERFFLVCFFGAGLGERLVFSDSLSVIAALFTRSRLRPRCLGRKD